MVSIQFFSLLCFLMAFTLNASTMNHARYCKNTFKIQLNTELTEYKFKKVPAEYHAEEKIIDINNQYILKRKQNSLEIIDRKELFVHNKKIITDFNLRFLFSNQITIKDFSIIKDNTNEILIINSKSNKIIFVNLKNNEFVEANIKSIFRSQYNSLPNSKESDKFSSKETQYLMDQQLQVGLAFFKYETNSIKWFNTNLPVSTLESLLAKDRVLQAIQLAVSHLN